MAFNSLKVLCCVLCCVIFVGCHNTHIKATNPITSSPQEFEDRQWFMLYGLLPTSDPGGQECLEGFSEVHSKMSGTDVMISFGLSLLQAAVTGIALGLEAEPGVAIAAGLVSGSVIPSSRTVSYRCRGAVSLSVEDTTLPLLRPKEEYDEEYDEDEDEDEEYHEDGTLR